MTGVESRLWFHLRRRNLNGHRFRRQAPIGPYVADFACLGARLIVEIDGPGHDGREPADVRRDHWLRAEGYRVLRFTADDVFWECEWVLDIIGWALGEAHPAPR